MPYTKQDLITLYSLEEAEINQTLTAAELSTESKSYTDEQIQTGFELIRSYFNSGQVSDYAAAAELFKQHQVQQQLETDVQAKTKKSTKSKKPENSNTDGVSESEQVNVVELLARASQQVGTRISLTEAVQIFSACGLLDKEQYSSLECDRFLEACELIKQQGKTYEEVAAHFGVKSTPALSSSGIEQFLELLDNSVLSADEKLLHLINQITANQANQTNIHQLVQWSYLKNAARQLIENQNDNTLIDELEQRFMDSIKGKHPAQSQRTFGDWEPISLPKSSPKQMRLPEGSDDGTSIS